MCAINKIHKDVWHLLSFSRYQELVTKYGKLEPLAEIDLRPQNQASVDIHYEEKVQKISVRLDQTVAEFKKQLKTVVHLSTNNMRIYYLDHEAPYGPEEMKFSTRALHSYNVRDGVEFYVEPKIKWPLIIFIQV